jgi:hypothetical protein
MTEENPAKQESASREKSGSSANAVPPIFIEQSAEDREQAREALKRLQEREDERIHAELHSAHHGHDEESEATKKAKKYTGRAALGLTYTTGGVGTVLAGTGAIGATYFGASWGPAIAAAGLKVLSPLAAFFGFPHFMKWAIDRLEKQVTGHAPKASSGGGGHGGGDHGGGHH